jgi:hypothetical protein
MAHHTARFVLHRAELMTDPLFAALPGPAGPLRRELDARLELEPDADPVLALVVRGLADRYDWAVAGRQYRGFVMITAEFRAAYRELMPAAAADDTFDALMRGIAGNDDQHGGAAVPGAAVRHTAD